SARDGRRVHRLLAKDRLFESCAAAVARPDRSRRARRCPIIGRRRHRMHLQRSCVRATRVYHRRMPPAESATLAGLFVSAFLSATLLPGGSEALLAAVVAHNPATTLPAVGWATLG